MLKPCGQETAARFVTQIRNLVAKFGSFREDLGRQAIARESSAHRLAHSLASSCPVRRRLGGLWRIRSDSSEKRPEKLGNPCSIRLSYGSVRRHLPLSPPHRRRKRAGRSIIIFATSFRLHGGDSLIRRLASAGRSASLVACASSSTQMCLLQRCARGEVLHSDSSRSSALLNFNR